MMGNLRQPGRETYGRLQSAASVKVLIVVHGGVVTEVFSTETVEVLILDNDEYQAETFEAALAKIAGELIPQALTDAVC
jgi:hypothetical protein